MVKKETKVEEKVEKVKDSKPEKKVGKEVKETKETPIKEEKVTKNEDGSLKVSIIVLVVVVIIAAVLLAIGHGKKSLEDELNASLKSLGEDYYTEFYYELVSKEKSDSELKELLEKYKDIGIKINLENIERYDKEKNKEEVAKFKNSDGKECNKNTTRAVIYPKSPYGKKDYTVEVELDCGFDNAKETK